MSRGKGTLRAVLSGGSRDDVLCGVCSTTLAYVTTMTMRSGSRPGLRAAWSEGETRRLVRFDAGWRLSGRGVWVLPERGRRRLAHSRPAWRRNPRGGIDGTRSSFFFAGGAEPAQLPVKAECPVCRATQTLDPEVLGASPDQSGDMRTGWHEVPVRALFEKEDD